MYINTLLIGVWRDIVFTYFYLEFCVSDCVYVLMYVILSVCAYVYA